MELKDVLKKCNELIDKAIIMRDEVAKECIPNTLAFHITELAQQIEDDLEELDYEDAIYFVKNQKHT